MIVLHMVVLPYGSEIVSGEYAGMEHPAERLRNEASADRVTLLFRSDTERTEDGAAILSLVPALFIAA